MKKAMVFIWAALGIALAGCSHNVGTAFNGRILNLGYDPELNKVGIQYYDGLMVTGVGRENSEIALDYEDEAGAEAPAGKITGKFAYRQKIGRQITGYYVDAIRAGATPESLDKYTAPEGQWKQDPTEAPLSAEAEASTPPVQDADEA